MKKRWTMERLCDACDALRGLTVFPNVLIHFDVAREISIKALEEAMSSGSPVFLVGQKDISEERPEEKDLVHRGHDFQCAADPAHPRRQRAGDGGGREPGRPGAADPHRPLSGGGGPAHSQRAERGGIPQRRRP